MNPQQSCAVVLGGSMAGLLAARVLSQHFDQVIIVERDRLPTAAHDRKGTPQGQHLHGLLARGYRIMNELFPGFRQDLLAAGALIGDISADVRVYQGRYAPQIETGIEAVFASRATLESVLRQRVLALPQVTLRQNWAVEALTTTADRQRVTGVIVHDRQHDQRTTLTADLVVDATGRGSATPKWLAELGYQTPTESVVEVGVGYATRLYRRTLSDAEAQALLVMPSAECATRGAGIFPIEGQRWVVTLSGRLGDHPPTDELGFLDYAHSLPTAAVHRLITAAEALGPIVPYKYPASRWRHYEQLTRFPQGLLVMGDAVASFNPIYGQGITVCALEAVALEQWLRTATRAGKELDALHFFQQIAAVIKVPWLFATGADTATTSRPSLVSRYFALVNQAAQHDRAVKLAFIQVTQLLAPPASLFHPRILARVLRHKWRRPVTAATAVSSPSEFSWADAPTG